MKLKLMPMVVGAIAITLTAAPLALQAQADTFDSYRIGQAQNGGNGRFDRGPLAGIDLSEKQREQLADIRQDTQEKMQRILTEEQRQQIRSSMENRRNQGGVQTAQGQRGRRAYSQLNLTQKQKEQMRKIMEEQRERMEDILTPQQREQMQRNMENRRGQGRQNFNR